nr:CDP-2,3-bis-(O-geranylgeranyl)-sn-glycerol synthase [Haladaptatus pallidirubidus]
MDIFDVLIVAVWAMLPAYVPNNVAVIAGGGAPIDGGRTWNGERILGDGKTWRGTIAGVTAGTLLAAGMNAMSATASDVFSVSLPDFPAIVMVAMPLGAMLGDMGASFLKRRTGRRRGAAFPGVDQLDFVVMALLLTSITAPKWTLETFTLPVLTVVVVVTPFLHLTTNMLAYMLGLKNEPW